MEVTANEQCLTSSAKSVAGFMSHQISCKYKLSSGRNHLCHSDRGNYQQDTGFFLYYNVLNLKLWMKHVAHKLNMANIDSDHQLLVLLYTYITYNKWYLPSEAKEAKSSKQNCETYLHALTLERIERALHMQTIQSVFKWCLYSCQSTFCSPASTGPFVPHLSLAEWISTRCSSTGCLMCVC